MERDAGVFDFCRRIVEDGKLTEDEVYGLSDFINEQVNDCSNAAGKWPTCIVLEPLKEVWSDGALDGKELKKLAEILVSIVYNSELESSGKVNGNFAKKCPHCDRVLMTSIIPRCSWCGAVLKENERYQASEDWLTSKKVEDAWEDVLSEKKATCYNKWFGRLYAGPRIGDSTYNRRFDDDEWNIFDWQHGYD